MKINRPWKVQEAEFVRKNYPIMNLIDLSKKLERTPGSIREYANNVLKVKKTLRANGWTNQEDEIILSNMDKKRVFLADLLPKRTLNSITRRKVLLKNKLNNG